VDVIEGRGPSPVLVYRLAQRLPDTSLTVALMSGGREHFGWGMDRYMQANIYDALSTNTRMTGNFVPGKAPKFPLYPRPKSKPEEGKAGKVKATVASIYNRFAQRR